MKRNNGWIPLADQKPTEADGETVLMWHAFQATMPEKPEDWRRNRFYVYWRAGNRMDAGGGAPAGAAGRG